MPLITARLTCRRRAPLSATTARRRHTSHMRYALQTVAARLPASKNKGWTANSLRRGGLQATLLEQRQTTAQALIGKGKACHWAGEGSAAPYMAPTEGQVTAAKALGVVVPWIAARPPPPPPPPLPTTTTSPSGGGGVGAR
jgi:hypothetical protein